MSPALLVCVSTGGEPSPASTRAGNTDPERRRRQARFTAEPPPGPGAAGPESPLPLQSSDSPHNLRRASGVHTGVSADTQVPTCKARPGPMSSENAEEASPRNTQKLMA